MARQASEETANTTAPFGLKPDGTPRKRAAATGPRKTRPYHLLFKAVDAEGNAVEGVRVQVILATKDTDEFMEALDQNRDAQRMKIDVSTK